MNALARNMTREHIRAMLRNDFSFFCRGAFKELLPSTHILWNWHLDLIASRLEDVLHGRSTRLIINIPPRYGKSLIASVAFPAFILGHNPAAEVTCISYGQDLAEKMASDTRRLMNGRLYQETFATRLVSPRARLAELRTPEGGSRLATSVDGVLTGRGGNFMIVDDPLKPIEAASETQRESVNRWFDSTATTRANDKETGAIVLIMQRLNEDDLVGHLLRKGDRWELLSLPAIAETEERHEIRSVAGVRIKIRAEGEPLHPERESLARINEAREAMGPYAYAAQYQQRPAPAGGGIVKIEWFHRFELAHPPQFDRVVQSWDTASRPTELADYSVCTTWGISGRNAFLIHVFRQRLDYPDLKAAVQELAQAHQANEVYVEDCASGVQLCQELCGRVRGLRAIKPQGNKVMRMHAQTGLIQSGRVFLPYDAPWLKVFEDELMMFDQGPYADQVDSTSQALGELFCGPYCGFLEMIREDLARKENPHQIRVNHSDPGRSFHLINGRRPVREQDGSFLVTEEEYGPLRHIEGLWRVD